jgi:hypothetical protein
VEGPQILKQEINMATNEDRYNALRTAAAKRGFGVAPEPSQTTMATNEDTRYNALRAAAAKLASVVCDSRPNPFPGNPLDEALEEFDRAVKRIEGRRGIRFFWIQEDAR